MNTASAHTGGGRRLRPDMRFSSEASVREDLDVAVVILSQLRLDRDLHDPRCGRCRSCGEQQKTKRKGGDTGSEKRVVEYLGGRLR